MRFRLQFDLENEIFPIQYRKSILSFIKKSLEEYNFKYFETMYNNKNNQIKPFTFAVFFYEPIFEKETIILNNKTFNMFISFENLEMAIMFYNSFNNQVNKKFSLNKNSWMLRKISMLSEKEIKEDKIVAKFMSPLVVRDRKDNKDYYYSFGHPKFANMIKINIKEQLTQSELPEQLADTFEIETVSAKKRVVKFYEKQMECSTGVFRISGDKQLLNFLYKSGIGSRHSSGFGMIDII